jgi:hypothetical protein
MNLKNEILKRITEATTGPVRRRDLYRELSGHRYGPAFDLAIQELRESGAIVQTESRNGTRGRIAVSYVPAPHE